MAMSIDSFEESSSSQRFQTTLYDMVEAVSNEIAKEDEMLVPAVACCIVRDCKARFVGNRINGTIELE
jgi:hypothetical protein